MDSDLANANEENRIGIEPPDQGFCVGNNTIVDIVNLAFTTYDLSVNSTSPQLELNALFGVSEADFLSDPRCYYDAASHTFFLTITDLGPSDPGNGVWSTASSLLVGVMPAGGTVVTNYQLDTTDDGVNDRPYHPNCPCFEDQPLLGADKYGIYISGNEFALSPSTTFNGGQIYAINKSDLLNGVATPGVKLFAAPLRLPLAGGRNSGMAASIQPAVPADQFETGNNGTEYFLSSLDFNGRRDNRIGIWAITNTCGIPSGNGSPACPLTPELSNTVIRSPAYGVPPPAHQKAGPFPLGQLHRGRLETIDIGDDRMQQVVFADGKLYAGLNTQLKVGGRVHGGILYFVVQPNLANGQITNATVILTSGYAALAGADLYYPSIAANQNGSAVMAFSMSGARYYPSAAYIPLTSDLGPMRIHIAEAGVGPYDGESGYPSLGGMPPARWGDYSAAFADENGNLWMATEYVSGACTKAVYSADPTCGGQRGSLANWGTYIGDITP